MQISNSKTTLQGIGLLGTYRLRHVQYPLKENPWRVIQGIANLVLQIKTLQGIGLLGTYRLRHVQYPLKENPWRVILGIANP
ncbi:MAG: hypothetical protein B7Z16_06425 [Algoriphagus sp. 32-45-6]|nr:MAG: hypothetical protein B7Z16_06425 [Algoriphagus sp. 32-45-6]